ncbi:MAG: extracellular solute-binding protein [Oscillospiraceae bacterium]|nr:extracellular solute-binding protein [Oscillospiraceae bacterium]MBQ9930591.1 extracellular solute-binding protein [Oscillospiraceae bacterium]
MKRILALLLLAVMVIGLVACSSTKTPGSTPNAGTVNFTVPDGGYDGSAVEIKFYHTMGANLREVLDAYIVEFNELYPNITIVHEQVGSYDDVRDQISTEIPAGNQPHIAYCYPDHVALYNLAGAVTTLDSLIDSTIEITRADGSTETLGLTAEQKADFIEGYYNEGKEYGDGLMYSMPLSKSTEVLYYNKTFFDANNLTVPSTWDELEALCAQIKAIDPECIPLGYDSEANWFITMCEQYGSDYTSASGDHFLFDNDQNHAFVKKFNEWYQKGYLTTQTLYGAYTSGLFTAQTGTKSYMSIGSSAGATHQRPDMVDGAYPFEVGIATIPQVDANNKKVISQGPSLCIFQKNNPQEVIASWLFVKFLTTTVEFQAEFGMASGYVPVLKSVGENPVYKEYLDSADGGDFIAALSAKVCLEQESAYYTSPAFNGSSTARDQVGALMAKCLTLTGDVDGQIASAFQDAIDECEYHNG